MPSALGGPGTQGYAGARNLRPSEENVENKESDVASSKLEGDRGRGPAVCSEGSPSLKPPGSEEAKMRAPR